MTSPVANAPAETLTPAIGCCFRGSESWTRTAPWSEIVFCLCHRISPRMPAVSKTATTRALQASIL